MQRIAIFASGNGSNADRLIEYFAKKDDFKIEAVICNKPNAGVLTIAKNNNIPCILIDKISYTDENLLEQLKKYQIDHIILAGFLWKLPVGVVEKYTDRIINIHPALLPSYGGKGMYGNYVHEAVLINRDQISGITIHLVNEHYDEGKVLFQASCLVSEEDNGEQLATKIHYLEHKHFAPVIHSYIKNMENGQ